MAIELQLLSALAATFSPRRRSRQQPHPHPHQQKGQQQPSTPSSSSSSSPSSPSSSSDIAFKSSLLSSLSLLFPPSSSSSSSPSSSSSSSPLTASSPAHSRTPTSTTFSTSYAPSPSSTPLFSSLPPMSHPISSTTAPQHALPQPPAAAMSVAYSLFLLGRTTDNLARPVRRLPVVLDLSHPDGVQAHDIPFPPPSCSSSDARNTFMNTHQYKYQYHPQEQKSQPNPATVATIQSHLSLASDLRTCPRHITIVTTAAIPWMTGTSVNPTLRAIYLARDGHTVTLVVPWLSTPDEQRKVFSNGTTFATRAEQADYITEWAHTQISKDDHATTTTTTANINVIFYSGVYSDELGSIMPVGAITDIFDRHYDKDVCILEEPEHLTWHHDGHVWTEIFPFVVGIIHTNYIEYAKNFGFFGPHRALALMFLNLWVCRAHCHRIVKLSDAVQQFPNSITSNVHGVRDEFIDIGKRNSSMLTSTSSSSESPFTKSAYFLGKVVWAKGYKSLLDLLDDHYEEYNDSTIDDDTTTSSGIKIDLYGSGADSSALIERLAQKSTSSCRYVRYFNTVVNHSSQALQQYKVFVNASASDVVCTATAEALAMGKFVICLKHPSNHFFATFPNCFTYENTTQFATALDKTLATDPVPLSPQDVYRLSWTAATQRLYDAMRLPLHKRKTSKVDGALGSVHVLLSKIYPQPGKAILRKLERERKRNNNNNNNKSDEEKTGS